MPARGILVVAVATLVTFGVLQAPAQTPAAPARPPLPPGQTGEPFPQPIAAQDGAITVRLREFAVLPDIDASAARAMSLVEEPGTRRLFVSDMRGILYAVSLDGRTVTPYLDLRDPKWATPVQSGGRERGLQSFAFHPQFAQAGTPGYGKFYTYTDISDQTQAADFTTPHTATTHDTVLQEWTATNPAAAAYDGAAPREMIRWRQPYSNHNGGMMMFNPTARPGTPEYGLLYFGVGDGGSGGDPLNVAQNLGSGFGKLFRIDPLGRNARNGKYGIPASNPFAATAGALPEIYAYGVRNTQGIGWDPANGAMFMSDIGQNIVEEISLVTAGANMGWNIWEGSYRYVSRDAVVADNPRSDPKMNFPVAEYDQLDPILLPSNAAGAVGALVYRGDAVPQLKGRLLFADMPSGELFHVDADNLPRGGQGAIRRVLFTTDAGGPARHLLPIVQDKNRAQGKTPAPRVDLRVFGAAGQVFLLNKADGVIRVIER